MTRDKLCELFDYDRESGRFFWRVKIKRCKHNIGDEAGGVNSGGYRRIMISQKEYLVHRLVWIMEHGELPEDMIDHVNHIRNDNRIENLALATNTLNQRNAILSKKNTSGVTGVSWKKRRQMYEASVKVNGKNIYLGSFIDLEDARKARAEADIKYGFHVNHGSGQGRQPQQ